MSSAGAVRVGGEDVRSYELDSLRRSVAMVLQKNMLFSGTIAENLRWGNENATDEELVEACRLAQAHEFIESFPDGYNTHIEQGGTNVSGGQKQRICIARALLEQAEDTYSRRLDERGRHEDRRAHSRRLCPLYPRNNKDNHIAARLVGDGCGYDYSARRRQNSCIGQA